MLILAILSFSYIFTFAIGAGPVTGLVISELSSNRTRGKIMGFSFSVHWVFYVHFFKYIGYCTYLVRAAMLNVMISISQSLPFAGKFSRIRKEKVFCLQLEGYVLFNHYFC